jgi:serine/threonine-protein kinase
MSIGATKIGIGALVSHYRLLELLGAGGMAVVYKAEDLRLKRTVALKFLPSALTQDESAKRRFVQEAQAASALDHPNICSIHEIDETCDGPLFICMSYYEGETLDRRVERGPLAVSEALRIVSKVAEGLACAHEHGIIHRDIKPANLMLTREGEVKILDFGLAKLRGLTRVTQMGTTVGTCSYMSPEQARGDDVDARADVFSLGVVLYELLTGRTPFRADHEAAVLYQIMHTDPKPAIDIRPEIGQPLQLIIDKALRKDVAARYQSISELREDLQSVASGAKPLLAKFPHHYLRLALAPTLVAAILALAAFHPAANAWIKNLFNRVPDTMHVAVLPFENVGQDPMNQAFCDGLMETLSSQLTQLERSRGTLWVVPASAVRAERIASPAHASKALGVNLVITGAVQRFGDRIRVTLNLVDAAQGATPRQLNSAMIDNLTTEVSTLQDETVMRMAGMMNMKVLPEEQSRIVAGSTSVSTAYDFYLQGLGYVRRYETEGNLDRAVSAFSMAIDRDSSYALAYAGLGEAYWRKYRDTKDPQWIEHALTHAQHAVELDSLVAPAHVTLGLVWSGTGRADNAIVEFERALALDPTGAEAYRGLATAYANMEQPTKAEETYQEAIDMKPDYWGGYNDFGMFYYQGGEYAKAMAQFRKVIELNPENKFGYLNLGACYWYSDQLDKAREMFERSLAAEPNFRAYSNLGALYYIKESYSQAAQMCEEAVKLNKTDYQTWNNLANSYYWIPGKRERAMQAYRQATQLLEERKKLAPRDPRLLASLAGYYAVLGEREQALSYINQATDIGPDNTMVMYFTGHAHEQLQQRDEAVACIGKALDGGYPLSELETDPFMHELRNDARYEQLRERGLRAQREQDKK